MEIKKIPIDKINPAPYNPRKDLQPGDREYESLKKSINEFGFVEPLVWNKKTGNLVGGHQRFKILKQRGDKEIDVSIVDLEPQKEKALNIALNKIQGDWDYSKLKEVLIELDDGSFDINLTGFSDSELKKLIDYDGLSGSTKEDDVPEIPKKSIVQLGDLWQLGNHRLLCSSSTELKNVEKLMNSEKASLVSTDPPYLVNYTGKDRPNNSGKDWSNVYHEVQIGDAEQFYGEFTKNALSISNLNSAWYCWHASVNARIIHSIWEKHGILVHQQIIWVKPTAVFGYSYYPWKHEPCWLGWQHEPCFLGWKKGNKPPHDGDSSHFITSVWNLDYDGKNRIIGNKHPTQKPVEIFAIPIRKHTQDNDICYEPFAGSGTQIIAAEKWNRRCYALEIEPIFCDVIIERWENFSGGKAKRLS